MGSLWEIDQNASVYNFHDDQKYSSFLPDNKNEKSLKKSKMQS